MGSLGTISDSEACFDEEASAGRRSFAFAMNGLHDDTDLAELGIRLFPNCESSREDVDVGGGGGGLSREGAAAVDGRVVLAVIEGVIGVGRD